MKKSAQMGARKANPIRLLLVVQFVILGSAMLWFLAALKLFLLDGASVSIGRASSSLAVAPFGSGMGSGSVNGSTGGAYVMIKKTYTRKADIPQVARVSSGSGGVIPLASEWLLMRSHQGGSPYKLTPSSDPHHGSSVQVDAPSISPGSGGSIARNGAVGGSHSEHQHAQAGVHADAEIDQKQWTPSSQLQWPPVQNDFSIVAQEGFDEMPMTKMKVPRFWYPKAGENWNEVGMKTNIGNLKGDGQDETIFLMIASYRDFQCRETITSAFKKADHPERLYVGAVDQIVPGDIGCLDIAVPCEQDPEQMICKYRSQISVYKMDASMATGPVTARHIGDRMYRGQYYVMQMDAHCLFVRHWDSFIIKQFKSTHNEMAVLTSYLTDIQGSLDGNGDSTRNTRPIMCNSYFEGQMPARYLRHGSQPEDIPPIRDMPQLQPFWAAGFSFSRGHFKLRVPYDAYQPMVFQGEEIAIGLRAFTHGYDFYAPRDSVVFHEYAERSARRKKIHMFWENTGHRGEGQRSLKRATSIIGMAPDVDPSAWDHSEIDKYGLGKVRSLDLFYKVFAINVKDRTAVQLCPFVKTGIMHKNFQKHLRANGLGIDYGPLESFDVKKVLPSVVDAAVGQKRPS